MTSIIKNQLIKHLSKFTKNLKPEQISLDVLKGNSKLQFIEINEEILTEILELPRWLRIKRAYCTGVAVNVPWTKLKSNPIQIFIDEINVDVELTSGHAAPAKSSSIGNLSDTTSYGFMNKIVENLSLYINTVEINFDSDIFGGSFMLQRLSLESRSPSWAPVKDLRQTRVTCSLSNKMLMFKQLSWHLLRIEASAKSCKNEQRSKINAPLRLITSGGKIRIALKKNSTDGSVIHARIQTILEDILWVATLPQLRSAISFASFITNLAQESQRNSEEMIAATVGNAPIPKAVVNASEERKANPSVFDIFNFDQTSYHLHVKKIDLHLCDDAHAASDYPPNWNIDSGAMQITLIQVLIDIYPTAQALSDRSTWMKNSNSSFLVSWVRNHLSDQFSKLQSENKDKSFNARLERCWPQLIGFFFVLRVYDLNVQCVSDMNTKKDSLTNLFQSERHTRSFPSDQQIIHVEFAVFSHPLTITLPVPSPAVFIQLGPFAFTFDERTTRWCFYVAHTLQSAIEDGNLTMQSSKDFQEPVFELHLVMPKIILNFPIVPTSLDYPQRLVVFMSTFVITSSTKDEEVIKNFRCLGEMNGEEDNEVLKTIKKGFKSQSTKYKISSSPLWIETDHGVQTRGIPLIHDVSLMGIISYSDGIATVITEPTEDIVVLLDHFQLQQLNNLNEQFETFSNMLSADLKHYSTQKQPTNKQLAFFFDIKRVRANLILTTGDMPTPYNIRTHITGKLNSSFMDKLSVGSSKSLVESADGAKAYSRPHCVNQLSDSSGYDNFPVFPEARSDSDLSPFHDETLSIATSIDDEARFEYEGLPNDDPFGIPELAEEAITIDKASMNDSTFQMVMSRNVNILILTLEGLQISGNLIDDNFYLEGRLKQVFIDEKLSVTRGEVNELLRKGFIESVEKKSNTPWEVKFHLNLLANENTAQLMVYIKELSIKLDEEILAHLLAFLKIEQVLENRIRLAIDVQNSNIQIIDRKKLKPLRLRIKTLSVEQEED